MNKTWMCVVGAVGGLLLSGAATHAQAPASPADGPALITLSPELAQVMADTFSDDFKVREAASTRLAKSLGQLTGQLSAASDPESQERIAAALRCNAAFSTWLEGLAIASREDRESQRTWGLQGDHLAMVADAYSSSPAERARAARKLAPMKEKAAQHIEAKLLRDVYPRVYIAAMEELWDVELGQEIVDALWDRGAIAVLSMYLPHSAPSNADITFRGKPIGGGVSLTSLAYEHGNIAIEVLKHAKSPLVASKVLALLKQATIDTRTLGTRVLFERYTGFDFSGLVRAYDNRDIEQALYELILAQPQEQAPVMPLAMAKKYWWSSRVYAIATLIQITGQDPEIYGLGTTPAFTFGLVMKTPGDEGVAVTRLTEWWTKNRATRPDPVAASQPSAAN